MANMNEMFKNMRMKNLETAKRLYEETGEKQFKDIIDELS